jgi:hypothetical protein
MQHFGCIAGARAPPGEKALCDILLSRPSPISRLPISKSRCCFELYQVAAAASDAQAVQISGSWPGAAVKATKKQCPALYRDCVLQIVKVGLDSLQEKWLWLHCM